MSKKYKIAIYSGAVPSTTFIQRLLFGLANEGYKILLFGSKKGKAERHNNIKYVMYSNALSKLCTVVKYTLLLFLLKPKEKEKLDKIIERSKKRSLILKLKYYPVLYHCPNIFHLQWAKSISDWIWVREFGIKLIVGLRGAHINYSPIADTDLAKTYEVLFPEVDGFHAVSKAMAAEAMKYNAEKEKIKVVYSGLNMGELTFQKKETVNNKPLKVISVGRAHWKKGYSHALRSVFLLKEKGVDLHYTIVGVESNEELLYVRSSFGLEKEVSFIPELPFEDVICTIRKADIMLLSSVEEGIANVVLESMAVGTLIVSTNCGGMSEVITNGENGYLVPVRDSEAMAVALKKASELSVDEYDRMVKNARIKVEEQHSLETMISGMRSLYHNVIIDKL